MEDTYRKSIIDTVRLFEKTLDELHLIIVNLAMNGEYSNFNAMWAEGEEFILSIDDFRHMEDQNVQKAIALFDQIYRSYVSMMNINAIKREEIDTLD